jgi:hypothetical protein
MRRHFATYLNAPLKKFKKAIYSSLRDFKALEIGANDKVAVDTK